MSITIEIAVLCALLATGAFYVFRPLLSTGNSRQLITPQPVKPGPQPYRAAALACDGNACQAARELRGEKFLANQAPHLPLQTCDKGQCDCHFAFYSDRRSPISERRSLASAADDDERRRSNGRRRTDWRLH